ncbi:MAG: hypothetical protein JSW33_12700 [bacterium]|nr:MAG: hypothetical protein JSW33_12700 [bacterium]
MSVNRINQQISTQTGGHFTVHCLASLRSQQHYSCKFSILTLNYKNSNFLMMFKISGIIPMKNRLQIWEYTFLFIILIIFPSESFAQGISRSTGFGIRMGAWSKNPGHISFISQGREGEQYSGTFYLYFFTRFRDHWFWEFNIGGILSQIRESEEIETRETTGIVPMIFGLRNDFIAHRNPGRIQPYYGFGMGPYLVGYETRRGEDAFQEEGLKLGVYGGAGVNAAFTTWFTFNADLKYHMVNLSPFNEASGFNLNFGISFMWGGKPEMFRIRDTRLVVTDIYPAYYQFYNIYPLALVSVQNTSGYPIEVNVKSQLNPFSSRPKDSGYITLQKGEIKDIPATVIFNADITQVSSREPAVLDIVVEGRARTTLRKEITAQVTVHTRNSWNGEVDKLVFFVTPENDQIMQLSRQIADTVNDSIPRMLRPFTYARDIFETLSKKEIKYQNDPNVPYYQDDRVQYAEETLHMRSGDCDDLVILYSSLLESLGINTAFIQVRDPEQSIAHLYLIFDSGIVPDQATFITSNEKRYLVRNGVHGDRTVWIPVETTLVHAGFESAWSRGALNFLKDGEMRHGLRDGWVQIIDVQ